MDIFDYIKAANFFPKFCPSVSNWKGKMRGKNTRGTPVEWTEEDRTAIVAGVKKFTADLEKRPTWDI